MNTTNVCEKCGAPLPADAPRGLCPPCMMQAALDGTVETRRDETSADDSARPISCNVAAEIGVKLRYFGDYELLEKIAQGGMGVVYKARQVSLNRTVAVKMILSGQLASKTEVQRFLTEAEAAANLQHPNIVAIHEIGHHEGQHYFSMDYVAGKNLAELSKDGPFSPARAAELARLIAEAIQYAHQRGILHRDLKPQNVLVDERGQPRITDFGLAKRFGVPLSGGTGLVEAGTPSELTQTGAVIGSPSYMPPEQAAGSGALLGPASDVYSLGAILYQLLTGRPPFTGEHPLAVMQKVMTEEPQAPSKLNAQTPADLETICLKCLEKQPERRYASARDLAEELGRFLNHEPILARRASVARRAWNWCRLRPWAVTGTGALAMMALVGLAFWLWEQNRLLQWKQAHPGLPPVSPWPEDHFRFPIFLAMLGTMFAWMGYFELWKKRSEQGGIPRSSVTSAAVFGSLLALIGVVAALTTISWHVWKRPASPETMFLPQSVGAIVWFSVMLKRSDVLLPKLILGFVACWSGGILLLQALREQERVWHGASPGSLINVVKSLRLDGMVYLAALAIQSMLLSWLSVPLVAGGQFRPQWLFLANGVYFGTTGDEANYAVLIRQLFAVVGTGASLLPLGIVLWTKSAPPSRDLMPVIFGFVLACAAMATVALPLSLLGIGVFCGMVTGAVAVTVAQRRWFDESAELAAQGPAQLDSKRLRFALPVVWLGMWLLIWTFVSGSVWNRALFSALSSFVSVWPLDTLKSMKSTHRGFQPMKSTHRGFQRLTIASLIIAGAWLAHFDRLQSLTKDQNVLNEALLGGCVPGFFGGLLLYWIARSKSPPAKAPASNL